VTTTFAENYGFAETSAEINPATGAKVNAQIKVAAYWILNWFRFRCGPPGPAFGHLLPHGGEGLFLQWCRTKTG